MVATRTSLNANERSGASAITSTIVEQLGFVTIPLQIDEAEMVGIDLRHDERDIGVHTVRAGVTAYRDAGTGHIRLERCCNFGGKCRKDQVAVFHALDGRRSDDDVGNRIRKRRIKAPIYDTAVFFSCTPFRSGERLEIKPWMISQKLNEALSHRSGGTKHPYIYHRQEYL
jgi:hypothetical protein